MKCSLGFSNFLEEVSSLPHSIVFLYFFALITVEGFLISPCYSLEQCIQMGISFLFSFAFSFSSLLFSSQLFVKPPQTTILPSCISFSLGWFWSLPPGQCFYIYLFTVMESVPSFPHFILFIFYLSICTHKFIFFLSVILFILMLKLSQSWP